MKIETTKPIIILSGPVGSGKSTVAQEIIKASSNPIVYIVALKFSSLIWTFYPSKFS